MRAVVVLVLPVLALLVPAGSASPGEAFGDLAQSACLSSFACEGVDAAAVAVDDACASQLLVGPYDPSAALVADFTCTYGEVVFLGLCHDGEAVFLMVFAVPRFLAPGFAWPSMQC